MLLQTKKGFYLHPLLFFIFFSSAVVGQNTQIRGFVDALTFYNKGKVSFSIGEQDLFISSELSDRVSFLGETVFKFDPSSQTQFSISVERIIIKYNIKDNHNIIIGKMHTPLNYWNDTYHNGRVFFPTIERPLFYWAQIIPLNTTGISFQAQNLGKIKFGYDVLIGNGLGSTDVLDNDQRKSITAAMHIRPADRLRIGISYYNDAIAKGSTIRAKTLNWKVKQNLFSASVAYFGNKYELLAESTLGINKTDTTGSKKSFASYVYTGYRINEKLTPYLRLDNLAFKNGEIFYDKNNTNVMVAGIRYQLNYLAVLKIEYQHQRAAIQGITNKLMAQFAIGF